MRIIRGGHLPGRRPHIATCRNCETEFEFEEVEAAYRWDQRDGDYFEINCPFCDAVVTKSVK